METKKIDAVLKNFLEYQKLKIISKHEGENSIVWIIEVDDKRYVLREKKVIGEKSDFEFEARYLCELSKKKLPFEIPHLLKTVGGDWNLNLSSSYTLYLCIEGEKRYEWYSSVITIKEIEYGFRILAQLHNASRAIVLPKTKEGPSVPALLKNFRKNYIDVNNWEKDKFTEVVVKNLPFLLKCICDTQENLRRLNYDSIPSYPLHYDFHFGNTLWKGDKIVGLVDFDWCQYNTLVWDFCRSCKMLCGGFKYSGGINTFDNGKLVHALKAYNEVAKEKIENIELIRLLMPVTSLFLINWSIENFKLHKKNREYYFSFFCSGVERLEQGSDSLFVV